MVNMMQLILVNEIKFRGFWNAWPKENYGHCDTYKKRQSTIWVIYPLPHSRTRKLKSCEQVRNYQMMHMGVGNGKDLSTKK